MIVLLTVKQLTGLKYETAMGKVITKASICISQKTRTL
jgi:hypothetical protein